MTLDEAIKHCEEKAEELKKEADYLDAPYEMDTSERTSCLECANDHLQLAEWLKELKARREADMTKNCFGCNGDKDFGCEDCLNKFKGDLISREALKKKCAEEVKSYNNSDFIPCPTWNKAMDLINDAPTVSFVISPDYVTELQNLNKSLVKQLEEAERPQGEWIITSEDTEGIHHIKCPFCKYEKGSEFTPYIKITFDELPYFCEKCGADMRGEE